MSTTNRPDFLDTLPSDITKALGPKAVAGIFGVQRATRKNGDLVIIIRREGVNGGERWVSSPKPGASWKREGAWTRVKM